ncbi:MAG: hypothetical protein Q8M31_08040 [Beijerinckiaceae bacterium]|nr:hypothetical protein [Beijerinckiaceae bacterium]
MNRRYFLLGIIGAAASGAAIASAQAAPAQTLWDDLQGLDAASPAEDLPAEGASEAQNQRSRGRGQSRGQNRGRSRGRRAYGQPYRGRGRAYGRSYGPRRPRRRVCRVVRNRRGVLVRQCWYR